MPLRTDITPTTPLNGNHAQLHNDTNVQVNANTTDIASLKTGKAEAVHTHDDRYYTESEVDAKIAAAKDTHYTTSFTNLATVTVAHNLGKRPAITVMDSAGTEIEGEVIHDTLNQVTLKFSSSFSGTVTCN